MQPNPNLPDEKRSRLMGMLDQARRLALDLLYEQANGLLDQVKQETQFDPAYKDLYDTAERMAVENATQRGDRAAQAREGLTLMLKTPISLPETVVGIQDPADGQRMFGRLEGDIQEAVDQWDQAAQQQLGAWRLSLAVGKKDSQLEHLSRQVSDYLAAEKRRLYTEGVEQICNALYACADELMSAGNIAPATILTYYDAALAIVSSAAGKEERLEPLRQRAEQRRTERALANVVYTSAVQGEQYVSELQRLGGMKAGSKVPRTRFAPGSAGGIVEVFDSYIAVEEAIRELRDLAEKWAGVKLLEYLDRADTHLREHNPNAAETGLLEDRKKIDAFITPQDKQDIDNKLAAIREEKVKLERATKLGAEALDLMNAAPPSPLAAWERLQQADTAYEWAPKIEEARRAITNHLRGIFDQRQREADGLFVARDLAGLRTLVAEVERSYARITDSLVTVEIEALRKKRDDLENLEQTKYTAKSVIEQIRQKAADNPLGARSDLENFRAKNALIISEIPEFLEVEALVLRSMGAQETAQRLERDLTNQSLDQVSDAVKLGNNALQQHPDHLQLKRVVANLTLHETLLRARQSENLKKYEEAYRYYAEVMQNQTHPDYVEANAGVDRLRRQQDSDNTARDTLEHARELLRSGDPVGAFRLLKDLPVYAENLATDLGQQRSLARTQALTLIQSRMKAAQAAAKIPIEQVQDDLNALQLLNWNDEYESWSVLFNHAMAAQRAEALAVSGEQQSDDDLAAAIAEWEDAIRFAEQAKAKELTLYRNKLAAVRRRYASTRLLTLRAEIAIEGGEAPQLDARIADLEEDLKRLIEMNSADGEIQLWRAQLGEAIGRYSLSPTVREAQFRTAQIYAEAAQQLLKGRDQAALLRVAKELIENAKVSLTLAAVMRQIEPLLISKDVASVREAVSLYQSKLETPAKETYHAQIQAWWDVRVEQALRETNDQPAALVRPDGSIAYDRMTRALLINRNHVQAAEIMGQIDKHWANDRRRLNELVRHKLTAAGVNKSDGWERLETQIRTMEAFVQDLNALAEVKRLFATDSVWGARLNTIQLERFGELKDALDELTNLREKLQGVRYALIDSARTGQYEVAETLLAEVETYQSHPAYKQVQQEIEHKRTERAELEMALSTIQAAIDTGCFHDAYDHILALDSGQVAVYGLYNALSLRTDKGVITDFSGIEAELVDEGQMVRTILEFALQFGIRCSDCSSDNLSSSPRTVLDWEAHQRDIRQRVQEGNFSLARALLEEALRETAGHLNLQQAIARLEYPPYGENETGAVEPTVEARYIAAQQRARYSPAAVTVLRELQAYLAERRRDLRSAAGVQEAADEGLRAGESAYIDQAERAWKTGWQDWEQAIREIGIQFDTVGGIKAPRVPEPARLGFAAAVGKARAAYAKCKQVCPAHPQLKLMIDERATSGNRGEGLFLYWRAEQISNGLR